MIKDPRVLATVDHDTHIRKTVGLRLAPKTTLIIELTLFTLWHDVV